MVRGAKTKKLQVSLTLLINAFGFLIVQIYITAIYFDNEILIVLVIITTLYG